MDYIKLNYRDVQTIVGLLDGKQDRNAQEDTVLSKCRDIARLMKSSVERPQYDLLIDKETSRLTIVKGNKELSQPVPYNGIAKLDNYFAVTDYYSETFPPNVLLRYIHANAKDRKQEGNK